MYSMLTLLLKENSLRVVELVATAQGKREESSKEVVPGPPPMKMDVGAVAASSRASESIGQYMKASAR
jgi:hypothetical protein